LKNLAQKLKFFRISQGFSQSDIAKMLNIPQTTWSGYERGRSNPTIGVLSQLEKLGFDYKSGVEKLSRRFLFASSCGFMSVKSMLGTPCKSAALSNRA